jgi:hypothetical protein
MATTATDLDTLKQALYEAFNTTNSRAAKIATDTFDAINAVATLRNSAARTAEIIVAIEQGKGPSIRK